MDNHKLSKNNLVYPSKSILVLLWPSPNFSMTVLLVTTLCWRCYDVLSGPKISNRLNFFSQNITWNFEHQSEMTKRPKMFWDRVTYLVSK